MKLPIITRLKPQDPKPANGQWFEVNMPGVYAYDFQEVELPEALSSNNGLAGDKGTLPSNLNQEIEQTVTLPKWLAVMIEHDDKRIKDFSELLSGVRTKAYDGGFNAGLEIGYSNASRKPEEPLPTSPSEAGELEGHMDLGNYGHYEGDWCETPAIRKGLEAIIAYLTQQREAAAYNKGIENAAKAVIRRTEIPKDARNPTRDSVVILGEEIAYIVRNLKKGNV